MLKGKAHKYGADVDTDAIIPARFLNISEPGELEVFIDDDQISTLEKQMAKDGYLDGSGMATTVARTTVSA